MSQLRKKIAAFRPENVLERSREKAERYGFDFFGFPLFELVERKEALKEIQDAFNAGVDMVVFTSLNGVKNSFDICEGEFDLKKNFLDADVELCAIGPATKTELEKKGLNVNLMPEAYSAEGLKRLFDAIGVNNRRIAFLRSSEGGREIIAFLERKGAFVEDIAVYRVQEKGLTECKELFADFETYKPDYVIFTSSLTFKIFWARAKELDMREKVPGNAKIVAIGDLTADTIAEEGITVDLVAEKSTFEDVLKALNSRMDSNDFARNQSKVTPP